MNFTQEQEEFIFRKADDLQDRVWCWWLLMIFASVLGSIIFGAGLIGSWIGGGIVMALYLYLSRRRRVKIFQLQHIAPNRKEQEKRFNDKLEASRSES